MNYEKWLAKNGESLVGKTVAVTGTTGGLGRELCDFIASLGARLILMDRNRARSEAFRNELAKRHGCEVSCININLEDMESVRRATRELTDAHEPDIFIHNAGAYSIPRKKCDTDLDNVYQINFASPYYMIRELMSSLRKRNGHVVVVGSIAHNYSKIDVRDIDFATSSRASKVYGNAKRYLMFSLYELFKKESEVTLSVTHPGITFTNITSHYPKLIFALIKHPMKVIFMKPRKAALCILKGIFDPCGYHEWIGPRLFDVWGLPKKKLLKTCSANESAEIGRIAEGIYNKIK